MSRVRNPFTATLGATPPVLVGRDDNIEDFAMALDSGPGAHERISMVTGARGVGKTVLLNAFEGVAREQGWRVFSETATPGFTRRLRDSFFRDLSALGGRGSRTRVKGIQAAGWGINVDQEVDHRPEVTLRDAWSFLLDAQAELDLRAGQDPAGVLVTIDELHHLRRDEVVDFSVAVQHLVRENREVAVVMAGIPSAVKPLLASDDDRSPITFLRRANRISLGVVDDDDVRAGLVEPVEDAGASWENDALESAIRACGGYPFMIQLVGQWSFRYMTDRSIGREAAGKGAAKARRKLGQLVHEPALSDLSDTDRTFLAAMAIDDGPSKVVDIAARMGVTNQYAWNYRRRLLDAEMIAGPRPGIVGFTLPYLREYLLEHIVTDVSGRSRR